MRPFGYEPDRHTVRDEEADLIRAAANTVLDGGTLRGVVVDWNDRGVRTPGGNPWRSVVLKRVLTSDRVVGKRALPDGTLIDGGWQPILDETTHRQLVDQLTDESRVVHLKPSTRSYLLTGGLGICGLCGARLIARPDNKGQRGYVCTSGPPTNGCGRIRVNGRLLEDEVATRLLARLMRPDFHDQIADLADTMKAKAGKADGEIAKAKERQAELGRMYADGDITAETMHAGSDKLNEKINEARSSKRIAESFDKIAVLDADDLVEWWEAASVEQQRTLLSLLVKRVEVHPAPVKGSKRFHPSRVKVKWT